MYLFIFVTIFTTGLTSAGLVDNVVGVADETFVYPCYNKLVCDYKGNPEHQLFQKCIDEARPSDVKKVAGFLGFGSDEVSQDPVEMLTNYYCKLDDKTKEEKFNDVLEGVLQYYKPGCASKNSLEECDQIQKLSNCALDGARKLYRDGKCNA